MGYTLKIPVDNDIDRKLMSEFLKEQYQPWSKLDSEREDGEDYVGDPELKGKSFEIRYNSATPERMYAWTLARFIALSVGDRMRFEGIPSPVPYHLYETDDDSYPVLSKDVWEGKTPARYELCSKTGYVSLIQYVLESNKVSGAYSKEVPESRMAELRKIDGITEMEMNRLHDQWKLWVKRMVGQHTGRPEN